MSNKLILLIILLALLQLSLQQRGRGRSSSFSRGFSRSYSPSYSRSYGTSYYVGGYSPPGYYSSTYYYGGSHYGYSRPANPAVVWGILGGIAGLCALCFCCVWWRSRRNEPQPYIQPYPGPVYQDIQVPVYYPTSFGGVKSRYYSRVGGMMGQDEFGLMATDFQNMLREVMFNRKRFTYQQEYSESEIMIYDVQSRRPAPLICEFSLRGEDQEGMWRSEGAFMMTAMGPFFWMMKFYDDRDRAGQTQQWSNLIYESVQMNTGWCEGRWFFENMENSYDSSGKWRIG